MGESPFPHARPHEFGSNPRSTLRKLAVRFLLDTNVLIQAEPTSSSDVEINTVSAIRLIRLIAEGQHSTAIHPASLTEVLGDKNILRRDTRTLLSGKYPRLQHPPSLSTRLTSLVGVPAPGSHNEIDLLLLSAVEADAVDYFVTEDDGIHRRARRVGLHDRVLTVADAILAIESLFPSIPQPPPLVSALLAHQLDESDPIFTSFRSDYRGFDEWLTKCKREHRNAWTISAPSGGYAGVCIVKAEHPAGRSDLGKTLKICSFKIANEFRGYRYGELLLKTVFGYLVENHFSGVFVETFAKQNALISLFSDFGFMDIGESSKGERVLHKFMHPPKREDERLGPLDFNIAYGPHAITLVGARAFAVPIQPNFHRLLFPDLERQLSLAHESNPFGNSLRKAYLCHSPIRKIAAGDALFFYRSRDEQALTAVGIVEDSLVSHDSGLIARFVGKRTVYSFAEIETMARKPVLALLFRFARAIPAPWSLDLLIRSGIVKRAPLSCMELQSEAVRWIATQLHVPH